VKRRDQIRMSAEEQRAFLAEGETLTCATMGPGGRPHLVPLWYVPAGETLLTWTYAASQKARNLQREPRATVLVESGSQYQELRGVSMECDVELVREPDQVAAIGLALTARHGGGEPGEQAREQVRRQAAKRVGLRFTPTRVASWDHRKLGGVY
jgi:PPOX class probable F420-dependent enzyme